MRIIAIALVALLALAFSIVNGLLMFVSPKLHAKFQRWYSRSKNQELEVKPAHQIQIRLAGIIIVGVSIFFAWMLAKKL